MLEEISKQVYNSGGVRSPAEVKERLRYWNNILRSTIREFKSLRVPQRADIQMITLIIDELEWVILQKDYTEKETKKVDKFLKEVGTVMK